MKWERLPHPFNTVQEWQACGDGEDTHRYAMIVRENSIIIFRTSGFLNKWMVYHTFTGDLVQISNSIKEDFYSFLMAEIL
jgi:hypothetical protein